MQEEQEEPLEDEDSNAETAARVGLNPEGLSPEEEGLLPSGAQENLYVQVSSPTLGLTCRCIMKSMISVTGNGSMHECRHQLRGVCMLSICQVPCISLRCVQLHMRHAAPSSAPTCMDTNIIPHAPFPWIWDLPPHGAAFSQQP